MSDSFRYWQGKKIEHAGSFSNLTLTLALGATGFALTLLEKKIFVSTGMFCSITFLLSLTALLLSVGCAFLGMASRLEDFGATAQAARLREAESRDEARLAEERATGRLAGERTKKYLIWQVGLFAIGVVFLTAVLVAANTATLFPSEPMRGAPLSSVRQ